VKIQNLVDDGFMSIFNVTFAKSDSELECIQMRQIKDEIELSQLLEKF